MKELINLSKQELTKPIQVVKKRNIRKYLEKSEITSVLSGISHSRDKMVLLALWCSGIRVSELISLHKKDVDFRNSTMRIRWLKSRKYNERIIPIKKELCQMLQLYTSTMLEEDLIFSYTRQTIFKIVRKYFPIANCHMLRHSFAINFLRQSTKPTSLVVLQQLLGHSNINTTLVYLQLVPSEIASMLDEIDFS